jgi:hypothetical protein
MVTFSRRPQPQCARSKQVIPTYYFPPTNVDLSLLRQNSSRSNCEWKEQAQYFDIGLGDNWSRNEAWPIPIHDMLCPDQGFHSLLPAGHGEIEISGDRRSLSCRWNTRQARVTTLRNCHRHAARSGCASDGLPWRAQSHRPHRLLSRDRAPVGWRHSRRHIGRRPC